MDPLLLPLAFGDSTPGVDPLTESSNLADARRTISNLRDTVADLERHVEKQASLLRALYSLLSERLGLTDAELLARFQEIDAGRGEAKRQSCVRRAASRSTYDTIDVCIAVRPARSHLRSS